MLAFAGCGSDPAPEALPDASAVGGSSIAAIAAIPAIEPLPCDPTTAAPGETVTRERGGPDTPITAVAYYHWAVITSRDTARAAEAIAPGNPMARPDLIREALNGYPPGTTYCLRLRQTDPSTVLFTITYQPPSGVLGEFRLRASVTGAPGSVRMTGQVDQ
ncbi:hypothetical protein [Williamsia sp.]|uniref:hypothetical protein n=1 Tax=Williamsia sp. TaxID=1872085 RepID=UPI001A261901|nr:hypothetical protein [Williamsia sp.]MBJ7291130.1 hypothetical protein [Williamsia sp.]